MYILEMLFSMILFFGTIALISYFFYLLFSKKSRITEAELKKITFPSNLMWSIGLAVAGYNFFFYDIPSTNDLVPGIGMGLFMILLIVGLLISFPTKKRTPLVYTFAGLGIVMGLAGAFRANEFAQGMNTFVTQLSLLALLFLYAFSSIRWEGLWILKAIFKFFTRLFRHIATLLKLTFQIKDTSKNQAVKLIKTVFITLVVLLFFATLLSNADPIFEELIQEFKEEAATRTFLSIILAVLVTIFLSLNVKTDPKDRPEFSILSFYDVAIPASGLVLLFGFFLFVQAKYLFGGHADLSTFDLTYSDYVRKGFVELLVTTFFGGLIAYLVFLKENFLKQLSRVRFLKVINFFLVIELFALLGSALKRDLMYMEVYGLTRIRLIGGVLLIWLAGFLLLLLIMGLLKKFQEKHLMSGVLALSILAFLSFNVFNMDRLIASADPPEGNAPDYFYINNLSADAIDGWGESVVAASEFFDGIYEQSSLSDEEKSQFADFKLALQALASNRDDLEYKFGDEATFQEYLEDQFYWDQKYLKAERVWVSWNWSQQNAYKVMQTEEELFYDGLDCLLEEMADFQIYTLTDLLDDEVSRVYDYEYPFVDLKFGYGVYDHNLESLIERAANESYLSGEFKVAYGEYWWPYIDTLRADEYGLFALLKELHIPETCEI